MPKIQEKCIYCGSAPVPHGFTWFNESLLIIITPFQRWLARRWFYGWLDTGVNFLLLGLARGFGFVGILRFSSDRAGLTIPRAAVLWDEADQRGYTMQYAKVFGKIVDFYKAKIPGRTLYFSGLPRPGRATEALVWLDDKAILKKKLLAAGVPVPRGSDVTNVAAARAAFGTLQKPVIVKPRLGSRGRHTSTNIFTVEQLEKAFYLAQKLCHWVIVEEQLRGDVYRGTVIGGKLVGVLGGSVPKITGDGAHTVRELITIKNDTRPGVVGAVIVNDELVDFIGRLGYTPDSVLPAGFTLDLGNHIGVASGGTSFEITDIINASLRAALEKAAAVIGDPIIGFDFIVEDPSGNSLPERWGIIEANGLPFIQLHHFPLVGQPNNVARHVWNLFDPKE